MSRHPSVKWAQRPDKVFITIELPDAQDLNLKLDPEGKFQFSATSGADKACYELELDLFDKVDLNESKARVGLRNICYLVKKAEEKWWDRLIKQAGKPPVFLKIDWDKWVDEDEEPEAETDTDFGEIDFSKLDMGGDEEFDGFDDGDDTEDDDDDEDDSDIDVKNALQGEAGDKPNDDSGVEAKA